MSQQSARILAIGNAQFTLEKPAEVKTRLKQLLDAKELTLRDIERFTTFAPSTISQVLSGTYNGDGAAIEDGLSRFYRNWVANNLIVETNVVKTIHAVMLLAWKRKEIAFIKGSFGRGKTKAASRFVALNDYACYVQLSGVTNPNELLRHIGYALDLRSELSGSLSDKLEAIIRALQRRPRLIVIDEADRLKNSMLALLQDLHGAGSERCAIVLIATDKLDKMLRHPDLGYLRRRITIKRQIGDVSEEDAEKIVNMWPHNFDEKDIHAAWKWSLQHYGVATLVNLMMRAYDEMQLRGAKKITSECLEAAYNWVMD